MIWHVFSIEYACNPIRTDASVKSHASGDCTCPAELEYYAFDITIASARYTALHSQYRYPDNPPNLLPLVTKYCI